MTLTEPSQPPVVGLEVQGPMSQRRWTVVLRIILALPALLYASILGIVVFFAVVAIWFAALVIGRPPQGLAEFVGKVVQYVARINGYAYLLLTDKYPPWDLDADYAVSVVLPPPGRLNRASVLFRIILLVPAAIVVQILQYGLFPVMFFVWLIVLVSGRMPRSVWEALSVILRYETRFYAFASMLTSEYPRGLFGDKEVAPAAYAPPPIHEPMPSAPPVAPMPPAVDPLAAFEPGAQPRVSRFVLSKGGKRLVVLVLVLGAIFAIASNALGNFTSDDETAAEIEDAYIDLTQSVSVYHQGYRQCALDGPGLPCVQPLANELAAEVARFRAELHALDYPAGSLGHVDAVDARVQDMSNLLGVMTTTQDNIAFDSAADELDQVILSLAGDVGRLLDVLYF